jgi:hypothetical protein
LQEINGDRTPIDEPDKLLERAIMLLLPFILGFSTTLVIMILNRFVEAVQSFFGKSGGSPAAGSPPMAMIAPIPTVAPGDSTRKQPGRNAVTD